uniref:Thioredoxin domain-containing protein n=1 Tax=viral metagenome TaxID=1070528 RepID=A0A6C0DEH8_9ZZZZ
MPTRRTMQGGVPKKTKKARSDKKNARKTARGHQESVSGSILPPLDVRSEKDLSELKRRIKTGLITVILIYADWCGHCHHIMPHFDAASKTPGRNIQSVKVNETMLDKVNQSVNQGINQNAKPYKVEGYPSIILVDQKGNKVSDVNPVKDTKVLSEVMRQMSPPKEGEAEGEASEEVEGEGEPNSQYRSTSIGRLANKDSGLDTRRQNSYMGEDQLLGSTAASQKEYLPSMAVPPRASNDMTGVKRAKVVGGSLYGALSQTAYTLAPAAALLGAAALMMKKQSRRKTHKRSRV